MKTLRTAAAMLFVIAGLGVIAFPWAKAWYYNGQRDYAINIWRQTKDGLPAEHGAAGVAAIPDIGDMIGVITIDKIGLKAPILEGTTKSNLDAGICSVIAGREMGRAGNYVLAGHKSRVRGTHFSRLSEVSAGDIITLENSEGKFLYAVYEVFSVSPDETWVLENIDDRTIATLITCDYRFNPINRLVVRGELIE